MSLYMLVSNLKALFWQNKKYLRQFDILKEADWMLFQASSDKLSDVQTILLKILWNYKYWCL